MRTICCLVGIIFGPSNVPRAGVDVHRSWEEDNDSVMMVAIKMILMEFPRKTSGFYELLCGEMLFTLHR